MMMPLLAAVVLAHCVLSSQTSGFAGNCTSPEHKHPLPLHLKHADSVQHGVWDKDRAPNSVYAGYVGDDARDYAQLEIYGENSGILRTPFGWFIVNGVMTSPQRIAFDFDPDREVPANTLDRQIVVRASQLLSSEAVWDRADTRDCKPNATKWSIYCALEDATAEIAGGNDHRRPALDVVRDLVEAQPKSKPYDHLLMDYNNDATTTFADVQKLFSDALTWIDKGTPPTP